MNVTAIERGRYEVPLRGTGNDWMFLTPRSGVLWRPRRLAVRFNAWFQIGVLHSAGNPAGDGELFSAAYFCGRKLLPLQVTYTMTVQDWLAAYRISGSHFRLSLINMTALGIISIVLAVVLAQDVLHIERLWRVQGIFPWHFVRAIAPSLAVGPAVVVLLLPLVLWLVSERQIAMDELGVTMQSKAGKGIIRWQQILDVTKNGDYMVICLKAGVIVIPRQAFSSAQVADSAYQKTLTYWREAKGLPALLVPDTAGVWPPAPRPRNSAEPGDGREG